VVEAKEVSVEKASDMTYQRLDFDVNNAEKSLKDSLKGNSLTIQSLSSLGLSSPPVPSSSINQNFNVSVESLKLSSEVAAVGVLVSRSLGLQLGLFHGTKRLCPLHTVVFRCVPGEDGVVEVMKVTNLSS